MLLYLISRVVSTVAGSVYPAYASYKAINSRNSTRLTAWLMYWTVMGIFSLVEFVLDTFIFWLPFYYEIKLLFVLWMILPQTQGSIYLYQAVVDPYLSQHEHDIDKALKDMQKQAMAMGMQYIKQAIQMLQNLAFDLYKKSQSGSSSSSLADKDAGTPSTRSATSISSFGTVATSSAFSGTSTDASANINAPSAQGYFSWAYHALSPKLAAVASMAASSSVPSVSLLDKGSARPLPVPPVDLYANRTPSTGSASSSSSNSDESKKTELDQLTSRLNRAAELSSLRNRKISLYDDENNNSGSETSSVNHSAHTSESYTTTWGSNFTSFGHNY